MTHRSVDPLRGTGQHQRGVLRCLLEHGSWRGHPDLRLNGWTWTSYSVTLRIMKSLVKRGFVQARMEVVPGWSPLLRYTLTRFGRKVIKTWLAGR